MAVVWYTIFLVFCMYVEGLKTDRIEGRKVTLLFISVVVIAVLAGQRDIFFWPDTAGYYFAFTGSTPALGEYELWSRPPDYADKGFFLLSVIIKTFTSDWVIYATTIALIGLLFMYMGISKYSIFPLFAFALYISRFMFGLQFIQIRSGVAIAIVFWAMQYVHKRDLKRYFLVIFLASFIHSSVWIAFPAYFLNRLRLRPVHIYLGLATAYILAAYFTPVIRTFVSESAADMNVAMTYTTAEYGYKSTGKGLANPMIYYQMAVLIFFTFFEKELTKVTPYYITLRNGYFYSTVWLTTLCSYSVLSGRGSSILATYEIVMIPLFISVFHKKNKTLAYVLVAILAVLWFYMNLGKRG